MPSPKIRPSETAPSAESNVSSKSTRSARTSTQAATVASKDVEHRQKQQQQAPPSAPTGLRVPIAPAPPATLTTPGAVVWIDCYNKFAAWPALVVDASTKKAVFETLATAAAAPTSVAPTDDASTSTTPVLPPPRVKPRPHYVLAQLFASHEFVYVPQAMVVAPWADNIKERAKKSRAKMFLAAVQEARESMDVGSVLQNPTLLDPNVPTVYDLRVFTEQGDEEPRPERPKPSRRGSLAGASDGDGEDDDTPEWMTEHPRKRRERLAFSSYTPSVIKQHRSAFKAIKNVPRGTMTNPRRRERRQRVLKAMALTTVVSLASSGNTAQPSAAAKGAGASSTS